MAIQRDLTAADAGKNKFDEAVEQINAEEEASQKRSEQVVKDLAGSPKTRVVIDKNGRQREIRVRKPKERKVLPLYLPIDVYNKLDEVAVREETNKNVLIRKLIQDFLDQYDPDSKEE